MTNLQKLQKKIQEAVPDIMELKEGCRVMWKGLGNDESFIRGYASESQKLGYEIKDILGRPITLEDVMEAMKKRSIGRATIAVDSFGSLYKETRRGVLETTSFLWKLNTPLHLQEQETIDFLLKVLTQ